MSLDLEVRADDSYTRSVDLKTAARLLVDLGARKESERLFVVADWARHVRVEIELVWEGPEAAASRNVNAIGFRVPAAFSAKAGVARSLAASLAHRLEWQVYDAQVGEYVDADEHDADGAVRVRPELSTLRSGLHRERPSWLLARLLHYLPPRDPMFVALGVLLALAAAVVTNRLLRPRTPFSEPPGVYVGVACLVLLKLMATVVNVAGDVVQREKRRAR
jgi:hypothetical protein